MSNKLTFVALAAVSAASLALAADFTMRPGRWETSVSIQLPGDIDLGGEEVPGGLPFLEPLTMVQCVSPEEAAEFRGLDDLLPAENCEMAQQDGADGTLRLTAVCIEDGERYEFDYVLTAYSEDHWAGEVKSRTSDRDLGELHMTFETRRTGDACTAEELAAEEALAVDE